MLDSNGSDHEEKQNSNKTKSSKNQNKNKNKNNTRNKMKKKHKCVDDDKFEKFVNNIQANCNYYDSRSKTLIVIDNDESKGYGIEKY